MRRILLAFAASIADTMVRFDVARPPHGGPRRRLLCCRDRPRTLTAGRPPTRRGLLPRPLRPMTADRRPGMRLGWRRAVAAAAILAFAVYAPAPRAADQTPASASAPAAGTYDSVVKPFLAQHCVSCHGPVKQSGSLALH